MKIAIYGRTDSGGIRSHVAYLVEHFSKKNEVRLISQDTFKHISFMTGYLNFDYGGIEKLKEALDWCDLMHVHHQTSTYEFVLPRIKSDKPIVNTFHTAVGDPKKIFDPKIRIVDAYFRFQIANYGRIYAKRSARYIPVGEMQAEILRRYDTTTKIPNGIPVEKFKKQKAERYFEDFTVGYIGRMTAEKNVESLIRACRELDVNLVIAGIGWGAERMKRRYESDKIRFIGPVEYPPTKFYNSVDLFCNPSFLEANINLTSLEALACETPVIVSGCGGEEKNILPSFGLVSDPDKDSLKKSIILMEKKDLPRMGRAGRAAVLKGFNIKDMADKVFKVYKETLA
jgi:glycosyltransferase involved in cell wall biosynthesis